MYFKKEVFYPRYFTEYLRSHPAVILCLILALGVFLRIPNLNESLWFDELDATHIWLGNLTQTWKYSLGGAHLPMHLYFMFFWGRLFGDSEISVRMPSMISGILSIALAYYIVLKHADKKTALLTAFFLAVSPVHIWYSQEARHYAGLLFFLLLLAFSYYRLSEAPGRSLRWYLVYSVSLFFIVFSHYYAMAYLLLISVMCLFKMGRVKRNLLLINSGILACFLLYHLFKFKHGFVLAGADYLRPFTLLELWMLFFNWFISGNSLWDISFCYSNITTVFRYPFVVFTQAFFTLIFFYGFIMNLKESRKPYGVNTIAFLFSLPAFLLILPLVGFPHTYIERAAYMTLPFFFMILAKGITAIKPRTLRVVTLLAIIGFNIIVLTKYYTKQEEWTVYKQNPDWRSAADYLFYNRGNPQEDFVIFTSYPSKLVLTYYKERYIKYMHKKGAGYLPYLKISFDVKDKEQGIYRTMKDNNSQICYLVEDLYWQSGFCELATRLIKDSRFQLVDIKFFKAITIFKFYLN